MQVRFSSVRNPEIRKAVQKTQEVVPIFRSLLTPVAVVAYALAFWRMGADLNLTGEFFIARGLLSHWQVWLALGIGTQITGATLERLGRPSNNRRIAA
ncbi:MAG TPA: hypothetical protein VE621_09395 [Bryobacteraceae bacterium]|jgi:hypothetical protein|nr:hypothetical protein [Bryobacteraceae bacterium]